MGTFSESMMLRATVVARRGREFAGLPHPADSVVMTVGTGDLDQMLLIGGGIVVGTGVLSHDLGLGGHLARAVSAITGRGVRLEVVPIPGFGISTASSNLRSARLGRFDSVVIAVGLNDALVGTRETRWSARLEELLDVCREGMSVDGSVHIMEIADPTRSPLFRRLPARFAARRARRLNNASHRLIDPRLNGGMVRFELTEPADLATMYRSDDYRRWARELAPPIATALLAQR